MSRIIGAIDPSLTGACAVIMDQDKLYDYVFIHTYSQKTVFDRIISICAIINELFSSKKITTIGIETPFLRVNPKSYGIQERLYQQLVFTLVSNRNNIQIFSYKPMQIKKIFGKGVKSKDDVFSKISELPIINSVELDSFSSKEREGVIDAISIGLRTLKEYDE